MRVRNAAILKGQDPDAAEEAYLASTGKGRASDTTAKRLDIHHHKPAKEQTPEGKHCLSFLKRKREQLQDLDTEISAMEDCEIDSEDPSIVELKKEKISIYAQMRKANKKLDDMAETNASNPTQDEPMSGSVPSSSRRFRVPPSTFTLLIGSSRPSTTLSDSARSDIQADEDASSNLIGANTLATLPSAPGRRILGGDSRTNRGGRIGITGRVEDEAAEEKEAHAEEVEEEDDEMKEEDDGRSVDEDEERLRR
jgi:hypothetical protein